MRQSRVQFLQVKLFLIALKWWWLCTDHIALHITLSLSLGTTWVLTNACLSIMFLLYSSSMFIIVDNWYSSILPGYTVSIFPDYTHFSLSAFFCDIYPLTCFSNFQSFLVQCDFLHWLLQYLLHLNGFHSCAF